MKYIMKINSTEREFEIEQGTNLLEALSDYGIVVKSPCGGKGTCGKCLIEVDGQLSQVEETERQFIKHKKQRLACKTQIQGNIVVYIEEKQQKDVPLVALKNGINYGIAVDVGTTSVHLSIVDLQNKEVYKIGSFLNPQRRFGSDVISRIAASGQQINFDKMVVLIRKEIEDLIKKVFNKANVDLNNIKEVVFSGNTVMTYIIFGDDITQLGVYPYVTERLKFEEEKSKRFLENIIVSAKGLPAVSAFLGGDLLGGLAFVDKKGYDKNTFFIDLGTNGEMFVRDSNGEITATSCAMGPALEGMNMSCGMTAEDGAINHLTESMSSVSYAVMGEGSPVGLSGTAIVDFISILLRNGLVLKSGLMKKNLDNLKSVNYNTNTSAYHLTEKIYISQKDVRNIQLAKGASLAGAKVLLKESNINKEDIKYVIIAGAFGENLNLENFKQLKFLPDFKNAEYLFMGNTSLKAAESVLLEDNFYKKISLLSENMKKVELSEYNDFNDIFMQSFEF